MTVTKLKGEMSATEYFGWIEFYNEKKRKEEAASGNILAMNPDDLVKGFGI
jgi:hypothetical protein